MMKRPSAPIFGVDPKESPRNLVRSGGLNGAQGRNRTTDTAIFSRLLYQLSYLGTSP